MRAQTNANYSIVFALTKASDGTPYDLTGLTLEMEFKRRRGSTAALSATTGNGLLSRGTVPTDGLLTLSLDTTTISALQPGNYFFDVVIVVDADNRTLLFSGVWNLLPGITGDATPFLPPPPSDPSGITIAVNDEATEVSVSVDTPGTSTQPTHTGDFAVAATDTFIRVETGGPSAVCSLGTHGRNVHVVIKSVDASAVSFIGTVDGDSNPTLINRAGDFIELYYTAAIDKWEVIG